MPNIKQIQGKKMKLEPIENAIIIHPHLLQKFLKHSKDYANLLALYSFYIYHAQLQKTNQPLVTDEFTRRGMNWASDRVKRIKKILKDMKVIEVVQNRKYYYVHLFFIYTKKKIGEILGKSTETEASAPNKPEPVKKEEPTPKAEKKEEVVKEIEKTNTQILFTRWLEYCDKNKIRYTKSNVSYWQEKLKNRITIDQQDAIFNAVNKKWKNFYIAPIKESKYHQFLGKSLMMERDCDTLIDISYRGKQYVYQFKNTRVVTEEVPSKIFARAGYTKQEVKTAPIVSTVQDKIMGLIKRF